MAGIPPTLDAETGTPAHEWAKSTTTAAFARDEPALADDQLPPGVTDTYNSHPTSDRGIPRGVGIAHSNDPSVGSAPTSTVGNTYSSDLASPRVASSGVGAYDANNAAGYTPSSGAGNPLSSASFEQTVVPPAAERTYSSTSTPGREFPGAYPREPISSIDTPSITDAAKNTVGAVGATAAAYIPVAKNALTGANNVTGTGIVGDGTARASDHDRTHETSLPSTEVYGAFPREHVEGASALPGAVTEEGIIRLPDEHSVRGYPHAATATYPASPYPATAPSDVLAPAAAGAAVSAIGTTTGPNDRSITGTTTEGPTGVSTSNKLPSPETGATFRTSLPSYEVTGQGPYTHQDGAGALPGKWNEPAVAALPDETGGGIGATNATSSATGTHPRAYGGIARPGNESGNESSGAGERRIGQDAVGGVGSLVGGRGEQGVALLPDERSQEQAALKPTPTETDKGDKLGEMDTTERAERHTGAGTQKETQHGKVSSGFRDECEPTAGGCGVEGERRETQMNLLEVNLRPRTHTLGSPDAVWHGRGVGTRAGYQDGLGVDIPEGEETGGSDTDYHPAELHPLPSKGAESNDIEQHGAATKGDPTKEDNVEGGEGVPGSEDARTHKASFMEKMKGEAKVLIGKMEGKKGVEKVQEGKRMKAGEA